MLGFVIAPGLPVCQGKRSKLVGNQTNWSCEKCGGRPLVASPAANSTLNGPAAEGTQGLDYGVPTEESLVLVQRMEEDEPGADFLMLEVPKSDVGSEEPVMVPADDLEEKINHQFLSGEALMDTIPDSVKPKTRADLGDQTEELEITIQRLGLGAGEAPVPSVAPGTEGESAAPVLTGFVRAADSSPTTMQNLEKETLTLKLDKEQGVFSLEGWENVLPLLPEKSMRFARGLTHGEVKALVCSFTSNLLTPDLVARIFEDTGSMDAGDLGQARTPAAATGADKTLVQDQARPPTAVIFHPKSIEVVKFKAELLTTGKEITQAVENKRRKIEAKTAEERQKMDEELQVRVELQRGAQAVEEAEGAATLRKLDLQVFRSYLRRKHEEQGSTVSVEALEEAQSSLAKAKQSNKDIEEEFGMRRQLLKPIAALALECRTNPINMGTYAPTSWTHKEVLDQIDEGKRPDMAKVVGYFWAPRCSVATGTDGPRHFVRHVQTWDLPTMVTMLCNTWTFAQIYQVWNEMPLVIAARRRQGRGHQREEINGDEGTGPEGQGGEVLLEQHWAAAPQIISFLAASDVPGQDSNGSVGPPGGIHPGHQGADELGHRTVVDVQMAWRCNCDLWWVAVVPPQEAEKIYRKLGYNEEMVANYMKASTSEGADRGETVALGTGTYPLRTVNNVSSICSPSYRKEHFGNKAAHAFWGKACCGLILSSISPWEMKARESVSTG
eukprot:s784_g3.t1